MVGSCFERVANANIHANCISGWLILLNLLLGVSLHGAFNADCAQTVSPENKPTALLRTHRQRSDTCKKPGTAFTMEYQVPGKAVRTLVQA
eukprot:1299640-Amphidinium_carterae.2